MAYRVNETSELNKINQPIFPIFPAGFLLVAVFLFQAAYQDIKPDPICMYLCKKISKNLVEKVKTFFSFFVHG